MVVRTTIANSFFFKFLLCFFNIDIRLNLSYVFCRYKYDGGIELNKITKWIKDEFVSGLRTGILEGVLVAIFALLMLNVWYILPPVGTPDFWAVVLIWIVVGFFPALLFYESSGLTYARNPAFLIGLIATIVLMSYIYHILACDILPYNLLEADIYVIFVLISLSSNTGFLVKIRKLEKIAKAKETAQ